MNCNCIQKLIHTNKSTHKYAIILYVRVGSTDEDFEAIGRDEDADESTQAGGVNSVVVGHHHRRPIAGARGAINITLHFASFFPDMQNCFLVWLRGKATGGCERGDTTAFRIRRLCAVTELMSGICFENNK